jgi:superfamily II DNA or RNA helicase
VKAILADALYVPRVWVEQNPSILQSFTYRFEQKVDFGYDNYEDNPVLEEYVRMYRPVGEYIAFCRGDVNKIQYLFKDFEFDDRRTNAPLGLDLQFTGKLKDDQKAGIKAFITPNIGGIFQAPPAYGKTVVMTAFITLQQQKILLLVNKVDLKDQFVTRLRDYTNINELEAQTGRKLVGELEFDKNGEPVYYPITVSTYQLVNYDVVNRLKKIQNLFGLVMVDECHRAPAASLTKILKYMNPQIFVGVSATPKRKDNYHLLLPDLLGPVRYESKVKNNCEIEILKGCHFPLPQNMNWVSVMSVVVKNKARNEKIVQKVIQNQAENRRILVITERVAHAENLAAMLISSGISAACVTGPMKKADRDSLVDRITGLEKAIDYVTSSLAAANEIDWDPILTWPQFLEEVKKLDLNADMRAQINIIYNNKIDVLVATKQLFSEGTDIPCIDTLHIVCPTANEVFIEQVIGRVQRFYARKFLPRTYYWADSGTGILYGCAAKFKKVCTNVLNYQVTDLTGGVKENDMAASL